MLNFKTALLSLSAIVLLSGCGSVHMKPEPTPPSVASMTDSKMVLFSTTADPFPSSMGRMSQGTKSDYTLKQGLHVVAHYGKDHGYKYFALTWPSALNNINGSSINRASEVWYYCGARGAREVFSSRSQCQGLKATGGISSHYSAVYFNEKPVDFVVWDIEETLKDPFISGTDVSFELETNWDDSDWNRQLSFLRDSE